ncbi:hypothetical protein [Streptomyces sp. NPDC052015]|uniref:hypothetical protein n=1 Tax=Streptomyces sp. NPDC052015 TaxID=3154755 RepID=UPI003432BFE7
MHIGNARRLLAVAAAVVAVALSGTGCSGQESTEHPGVSAAGDTAKAASQDTTDAQGRTLTYEELRRLAFKQGEGPTTHAAPVQKPGVKKSERTYPPVSDASCQSVLDVLDARGASAVVRQVFNWKDDLWGGASTLASYRGTGAEQAFDRLEAGLRTCVAYSGVSYAGEYFTEVTGVSAEEAGRVGDEALTFRTATPTKDGMVMHEDHVVVRTGHVTATFRKTEAGHEATFPRDLVEWQVERLTEAQRS